MIQWFKERWQRIQIWWWLRAMTAEERETLRYGMIDRLLYEHTRKYSPLRDMTKGVIHFNVKPTKPEPKPLLFKSEKKEEEDNGNSIA